MPRKLTVGSCFAGIGAFEKGFEETGEFETKWQIENDPYASAVLEKHWPSVYRYGDIVRANDEGHFENVDVVIGGFPCQDISAANSNGTGLSGKRSGLWRELFRTICVVRPKYAVVENVPMLLNRGMDRVLGDLADVGHDSEWGCLSAHKCGADHRRLRVFIIAYRSSKRWDAPTVFNRRIEKCKKKTPREELPSWILPSRTPSRTWAFPDTGTFRVPNGIAAGVYRDSEWESRLKCVGNAVYWPVSKKIGEMILQREIFK